MLLWYKLLVSIFRNLFIVYQPKRPHIIFNLNIKSKIKIYQKNAKLTTFYGNKEIIYGYLKFKDNSKYLEHKTFISFDRNRAIYI